MSENPSAYSVLSDFKPSSPDEGLCGLVSAPSVGDGRWSLRETAVSKLDVLRAKQINRITYFNLVTV